MTVVLTRPTIESEALARELESHDIDSIVAPLLSIVQRDGPDLEADLAQAQAVLLTSANGARAFAKATDLRDVALYVVGDATAAAARAEGFTEIVSADGDAAALAALVGEQLTPDAGPLMHASGDHVAGDIEAAISDAGFDYKRTVLYDAVAAETLPDGLLLALRGGSVDGVLLFSPRSARTFVHLVRQSDVAADLKNITAYCLSDSVAALADRDLWRRVVIAARPRSDSLVESIVADVDASRQEQAPSVVSVSGSPPEAKPGRALMWPTVAISIVASALVAVILIFALHALPIGDDPAGVPADLEARLRSLDAQGSELTDRLAAVEARAQSVNELANRVTVAEAQLAVIAANADGTVEDADLAALATELDAARSDLKQQMQQATQPLTAELAALSSAVDSLSERVEQAVTQDAGATGALLLAVGQLRAAALGPGPFAGEAEAVRALTRGEPRFADPLAAMMPWANQGVATVEMLQVGFQDTALAILRAGDLPEDAGWLETAYAEVKGLVSVRRVGEDVEGDDPQALLARAEAKLLRGDVAGAAALVEAIDMADKAAGDWLDAARGRGAVSAALDEISSVAFIRAGTATQNR